MKKQPLYVILESAGAPPETFVEIETEHGLSVTVPSEMDGQGHRRIGPLYHEAELKRERARVLRELGEIGGMRYACEAAVGVHSPGIEGIKLRCAGCFREEARADVIQQAKEKAEKYEAGG